MADSIKSGVVDSQLAEKSLMPFLLLLLLCFVMPVTAQTQWFDRHSEGWFWYETLQDSEAEQEDLSESSAIKANQPLSTAWIRQNIGQFLDKAIDDPSKDNVRNYLYLDRLIKEKAERFAHIGKQVIEGDPILDENVRRPISPAAAKIKDEMAYKAREGVLRKIARVAGLVFYYKGSCKLCHMQARTIQFLSKEYGFELIPVSTDGQPIPELLDSRIERSPPSTLNILTYPALFLMQPPNRIVLIRQGAISLADLTERVVSVAYEQGWISKKDYSKTLISEEVSDISLDLNKIPVPTTTHIRRK